MIEAPDGTPCTLRLVLRGALEEMSFVLALASRFRATYFSHLFPAFLPTDRVTGHRLNRVEQMVMFAGSPNMDGEGL